MPLYSHSRLTTFENCPRQYWYQYIGKPAVEEVDTIEAFLGTCVHKTLEELYRLRLRGRVLSEKETLEAFGSIWKKGWSDAIQIVSQELKADDYKRAGREALVAYHRRHSPFDETATLRLEERVILDLDKAGKYKMQGYVDRIARRGDGTYEIHDYKTSSRLPTQAEADDDRQLALYQIGLEGMWKDVEAVDLIWHYVRFDTDLVSHRAPAQLRSVREACIAVIDDIESRGREEESFPTSPSSLCPWCAYRAVCPATRHEVATRALKPREFKKNDGVKLVDRWAAIFEERKALQAQIGQLMEQEVVLQEMVEEFAFREGLESVVGSAYRADIRKASGFEFPRTGSEQRPAFDAVLKETGLWELCAAPNHQKLTSLLNNPKELPPQAMRRLKKFLEPFERFSAKLRKKKEED